MRGTNQIIPAILQPNRRTHQKEFLIGFRHGREVRECFRCKRLRFEGRAECSEKGAGGGRGGSAGTLDWWRACTVQPALPRHPSFQEFCQYPVSLLFPTENENGIHSLMRGPKSNLPGHLPYHVSLLRLHPCSYSENDWRMQGREMIGNRRLRLSRV